MLLLSVVGSFSVKADEKETAQGILATSKVAGACGNLVMMMDFQEKTQMPGGDEFLERFTKTEAARLGDSVEEFAVRCANSIRIYDRMWKAAQ